MGPGHVAWKRKELEQAVTSTCLMEKAMMVNVPQEAPMVRTCSDDVVMEERLRLTGDATLSHLRTLEQTGPRREKLMDMVRLFQLPTSGPSFTAVSG